MHVHPSFDRSCKAFCSPEECDEMIEEECPDLIRVPANPLLFGHIFVVYEKAALLPTKLRGPEPSYVCYNSTMLQLPDDTDHLLLSNETQCRLYFHSTLEQDTGDDDWATAYIDPLYKWLQMWAPWVTNGSVYCNTSTMYQCMDSSKCISKARLFDLVQDCLHNDDENRWYLNTTCPSEWNANIFKCRTTDECVPFLLVGDSKCDCTEDEYGRCDDEHSTSIDVTVTPSFQTTCDGFHHLFPVEIDGEMYNDETECEQWSYNNVYTRCNIFWNCPNGIDELNCYKFPRLQCPPNHHACASFDTQQMMCLPIERANDGHVDCVGGADEPLVYRLDQWKSK
jgi:hypothetical protein